MKMVWIQVISTIAKIAGKKSSMILVVVDLGRYFGDRKVVQLGERMNKEPENHTVIGWMLIDTKTGETMQDHAEKLFYKDIVYPDKLPPIALCEETVDKWAAWWHWNIDRLAKETKKKLSRQELPRVRMRCD